MPSISLDNSGYVHRLLTSELDESGYIEDLNPVRTRESHRTLPTATHCEKVKLPNELEIVEVENTS